MHLTSRAFVLSADDADYADKNQENLRSSVKSADSRTFSVKIANNHFDPSQNNFVPLRNHFELFQKNNEMEQNNIVLRETLCFEAKAS